MRMPTTGLSLALLLSLAGCGVQVWEPALLPQSGGAGAPGALADLEGLESTPYLKAHLHSGDLVVFTGWDPPASDASILEGTGARFDADRAMTRGPMRTLLELDSIALLESNHPETVGEFGRGGLMVWTGLNAVVAVACIADPKSCFGSCPTFYLDDPSGGEARLVAEGFSSSFARVLEARDLDALPPEAAGRDTLTLVMRNEAHETHAVRNAALLAVPTGGFDEILGTPDRRLRGAYRVDRLQGCTPGSPDSSTSPARLSCLQPVRADDDIEYFSEASSSDLAERELLYLVLPQGEGHEPDHPRAELGLVIEARNTLLTTFLFYESIAALGSRAGAWLASLERGHPETVRRSLGLSRELGSIEVQIEDADGWTTVGRFDEAGPIASDLQVVPLGIEAGADPAPRVRLRMAKGNWRIDRLSVAWLGPEVTPVRIEPVEVTALSPSPAGASQAEEPAERLLDPDAYLVTQRGESYRLAFDLAGLPERVQLFLDTRGYYYEWMRDAWMGDENPLLAALIFSNPRQALRQMAPAFKAIEPDMEEAFWSSRFTGGIR